MSLNPFYTSDIRAQYECEASVKHFTNVDLICFYLFAYVLVISLPLHLSLYPIVSFRFENNFGIAIDKRKEEAFALDKVFIINTYAVMYLANGLRMR